MANTNITRRAFTDLSEPQQIRELNRQMEWIWHQLLGGLTEKALSNVGLKQTVKRIETTVANNLRVTSLDATTISAALADFMVANVAVLNADLANINDLQAAMATLSNACIQNADIDIAQIKRMSTDTAFIREQIGGKVFIDDLAVSDANIVSLAAGKVMLNNAQGKLVELYVDGNGAIQTRAASYDGDDIVNTGSMNGNRIIANTITTTELNASNIFAASGTIMNLIGDNIDCSRINTGTLKAARIGSGTITTDKLDAGAVTAAKIATGAITADKIAAGAITADKLAANSVSASKITGGTLNCSNITVTNLQATSISGPNTAPVSGTIILKHLYYQDGLEIEAEEHIVITNGIITQWTGH